MNDAAEEKSTGIARIVVDAGYRQVSLLEAIATSLDQRAGVLIGLLAVAIAVAFQADGPTTSSIVDLFFWFGGFGLLFAALVALAASFAPKRRRYGPDVAKLYDVCLKLDEAVALEEIARELKEVWSHNGRSNEAKALFFKTGLWLSLSGLLALAFDILLVRPFT